MNVIELDGNICPNCKYKLDRATCIDDNNVVNITPGDISVCLNCQYLLVYDKDLRSQLPTQEQIEELKQDKELWNLAQKLRWIIKETI